MHPPAFNILVLGNRSLTKIQGTPPPLNILYRMYQNPGSPPPRHLIYRMPPPPCHLRYRMHPPAFNILVLGNRSLTKTQGTPPPRMYRMYHSPGFPPPPRHLIHRMALILGPRPRFKRRFRLEVDALAERTAAHREEHRRAVLSERKETHGSEAVGKKHGKAWLLLTPCKKLDYFVGG